ncbi:Flagellar hook-associated protein 2 [compost metagenome]
MATISSLGIGSGLDLSGLLNQLESAERLKLDPITTQQSTNKNKISAYGSLQSALTKLQAAAETLAEAKTYQGQISSVSGSGLKVAATSAAVAGSYPVQVTTLAQAQSLAVSGVASKTDALDLGAGTLTISIGSQAELEPPAGAADKLDVVLAAGTSLEGIRDAINAAKGGVTASIVNDGDATNPYRLVLTSSATGTESQMSVSYGGGGADAALFTYDSFSNTGAMSQTVQAADAALTVNGVSIVSQSNTIEGALQGVTLTVSATGAQQVLTVARDTETIKSAVDGFVSAYNGLVSTISSLGSYDAENDTAGTLLGDSTMRSVQSRVRGVITEAVGGELSTLTDLGITLQLDGKLKSDSGRLDELLSGDLTALSTFFAGNGADGGMASKVDSVLTAVLADDGLLGNSIEGLKARNAALDERYARMEADIEAIVERYRTQFAALDSLVAQMNSTSTYLSQQFEALSAQLKQ